MASDRNFEDDRGGVSNYQPATLESVQDFLIKLDIKTLIHLLEISIFSLNNVIVRLTKIMSRADTKLGTFLVNSTLKINFSKNVINISWSPNQIFFTIFFLERFDQF
jgi:hypothetical protein